MIIGGLALCALAAALHFFIFYLESLVDGRPSLVLLLSSPDKAGSALKQGVAPATGVALIVVGLLI